MKTQTTLVPKLWKLALLAALFLIPSVQHAQTTSRCPVSACNYTWDPVAKCCNPDPKFDCVTICF